MAFTLFPRLPPEIRATIWAEAARSQSRIVEVHWASGEGFTFHARPPALLSVCFESRAHAHSRFHDGGQLRRRDSQAPFCFRRDVLYVPYRSACSTSYAMALESFLWELEGRDELRHLALSVPFPERHLLVPLLVRGGFFTRLQARARRSCRLRLETLTLVLDDPFMERTGLKVGDDVAGGAEHEQRDEQRSGKDVLPEDGEKGRGWEFSVTREFIDVAYDTDEDREGVGRATQHFGQVLREPHDRWDGRYPQELRNRRDSHSWGPDLKISVKHADRIHGDFAIGTCSVKDYWVEAYKKRLRMVNGNVAQDGAEALP